MQPQHHQTKRDETMTSKDRPWAVEPTNSGRFRLRNTRTQDTADQTFATEAEAIADCEATNDASERIAADMRARSARAKAKQDAIAAIRPTQMLDNGNDY